MTNPAFSRSTAAFRPLSLVVAAVLAGVLIGCDTVELRTGDDAETDSPDEVAIQSDDFTRADLLFEPVSLSSGETFSIDLMDEELGGRAARITHEGTSDGRYLLRAQFDPLNPTSVEVRCRNVEAGTQKTMATLGGETLKSGGVNGNMVARGDSTEPTSYHFIQDGPTTVVAVDYDQETSSSGVDVGGAFTFPSSDRPRQCTHVAFVMEDVSSTLTADGIEFRGDRPAFRERQVE
jgi:hypothetical protein